MSQVSIGPNSIPIHTFPWINILSLNLTILDAAGEGQELVGKFRWMDGGTHTVSAAGGGKMFFSTGSAGSGAQVFANAGTNLRIGIQDVDTTALPGKGDGTFDVYLDLVGGTDAFVANTDYLLAFESGSKSVATGDLVSLAGYLTARGGADIIRFSGGNIENAFNNQVGTTFPYGINNVGGVVAASGNFPNFMVIADDGTVGWVEPVRIMPGRGTTTGVTFNSASTPSEYGIAFKLAVPMTVRGFSIPVGDIDAGDTFTIALFSDPFGTPSALVSEAIDPEVTGTAGATAPLYFWNMGSEAVLSANTWYAFTVRATHATQTIRTTYSNLVGTGLANGEGEQFLQNISPFSDMAVVSRSGGTGAFAETDVDYWMQGILHVTGLDNGGVSFTFGG